MELEKSLLTTLKLSLQSKDLQPNLDLNLDSLTYHLLKCTTLNNFRNNFSIEVSEEVREKLGFSPLKVLDKKYLNKRKGYLQNLPEHSNLLASMPLNYMKNSSSLKDSGVNIDFMRSKSKMEIDSTSRKDDDIMKIKVLLEKTLAENEMLKSQKLTAKSMSHIKNSENMESSEEVERSESFLVNDRISMEREQFLKKNMALEGKLSTLNKEIEENKRKISDDTEKNVIIEDLKKKIEDYEKEKAGNQEKIKEFIEKNEENKRKIEENEEEIRVLKGKIEENMKTMNSNENETIKGLLIEKSREIEKYEEISKEKEVLLVKLRENNEKIEVFMRKNDENEGKLRENEGIIKENQENLERIEEKYRE